MSSPSDLRARLASLGYSVTSGAEVAAPPVHRANEAEGVTPEKDANRDTLEDRLRRFEKRAPTHPIDEVVEGSYFATDLGSCYVVERVHSPGHPHGSCRLDEALEIDPALFAWLGRDEALACLDLGRCAFIDVETTGLAGGTGTYAFLVGLGFFQGSRFVVRQFFMEDFDGEEALLQSLSESLEPLSGAVTFNGKAFDLPLLETRFQMARLPFSLKGALHLDLLFPSRRVWKERLESCALSYLEGAVLGVEREGDVPGWLIPGLYFDYLRSGDARPLAPVFEHNRLDILSMAALMVRLSRQFEDPFAPEREHPLDLCGLGAAFEGLGLGDRAAMCYERALGLSLPKEARGRTMVRLGNLYKRLRQREDAVSVWQRLAGSGYGYTTVACVELAKHFEHAAKDYIEAEKLVLQALAILELRSGRGESWRIVQEREQLEHRLARIRRKKRSDGERGGTTAIW